MPIQVIKHLEIGLNLENGMLSYAQFVDSVQSATPYYLANEQVLLLQKQKDMISG